MTRLRPQVGQAPPPWFVSRFREAVLPQFLYPSLATSAAMVLSFVYLFWRTREYYLLFWTWAAVIWVFRYALEIWGPWNAGEMGAWVLPSLAVLRGLLMYFGAQRLRERDASLLVVALAVLGLVWNVALADELYRPIMLVLPYGLLGLGFVAGGIALASRDRLPRAERWVTGGAMTVFGLIQVSYPAVSLVSWLAPVGFSLSSALQTIVAVGILLLYFRRSVDEARAIARREELALTRALSDFVSICAHCHGIHDDDGGWVPVEQYVAQRTEASVNSIVCPSCRGASG